MHDGVELYLTKYAEPFADFSDWVTDRYSAVVVVPAFDEGENLDRAITSLILAAQQRPRALIIVVVNGSDEASDEAHQRNADTLFRFSSLGETAPTIPPIPQLIRRRMESADVWVLDYASPGRRIPFREGVGRARKIGCDLALGLWFRDQVESPWIRTTDADVTVPLTYFDIHSERQAKGCAAWVYPFRHVPSGDPAKAKAITLYDGYLRYYVAGLCWAGSPYDFPTIGSTIAVDTKAYAAVRGFPRRNAAEDFYILDKLRKVGDIREVSGSPLVVSGRASHRVPFGTGRAVTEIAQDLRENRPYYVENPLAFVALRAMLSAMDAASETGGSPVSASEVWKQTLLQSLPPDPALLSTASLLAAADLGAEQAIADAAQRVTSIAALKRRLAEWFDAFRTLKFLHALRDHGIAGVAYETALLSCPFTVEMPTQADVE